MILLNEQEKLYNLLYENIDGPSLSWKARKKLSEKDIEHLIYGEIDFNSLFNIFNCDKIEKYINSATNFYDLGSGIGKIVFGAALLLNNVKNFVGIEILEDLVNTSNELKNKFKKISSINFDKIDFIRNDFFNINYKNANILFMHYPMKNAEDLYSKLENKFNNELSKNTLIISAIRKLKDLSNFPCIGNISVKTNYGDSLFYYHLKV